MDGPFGAGQYVLGALLGLALGLLFGYGNMRITKRAVKKNNGDGLAAVAATNMLRSLVNVIALAIVFFTRKVVPLPFYATLIATATGLAIGNVFFTWLLTKEMKRDMEAAAAEKAKQNGGESNEN
jgi:uncharacterized membrane-anchored protein YhcB (DUF1043 family)